MIRSFKDRQTEKVFHGIRSRKFQKIEKTAIRRLFQLDSAEQLEDLRSPGASLEALKATGLASTVSASMTSTESVSVGSGEMLMKSKSSITTEIPIKPPHPGETIREDYLAPLGLSVNQLAKALGLGASRLNEIVRGDRGITADTALRLGRCLGTSPQFWLNLQSLYDLRIAERKARRRIEREVKPLRVA